jgi:hypothetical protein
MAASAGEGPLAPSGDQLLVTYMDTERLLDPDDSLTFGRGAELDIDSNPYLHRGLGRFVRQDGTWWLENVGSKLLLTTLCPRSRLSSSVPPGRKLALVTRTTMVRFSAGSANYELAAEMSHDMARSGTATVAGTDTATGEVIHLNDEHRRLLCALAELRLRDPTGTSALPSNQVVARRLGWSLTKVNRKIDWLCAQYTRSGVKGLHGGRAPESSGRRASDRRRRLVDHVVATGAVTADDLALLDPSTIAQG